MKIICIGRNYAEHAKEMNAAIPDKPVIFLKPDTALLNDNKPFYIPDWAANIHYETEIVYKIGRAGKYIDEKFAYKYMSSISLGIDFTARALQAELKEKRLPWELSKAFDNSAVVGHFLNIEELKNPGDIHFYLEKNGETVQKGNASEMIFPVEKIIAFVSQYFTLKTGDLIFTGTPEEVGPVHPGDELAGYLNDQKMFSFKVK